MKLKYDELLPSFACTSNLRPYAAVVVAVALPPGEVVGGVDKQPDKDAAPPTKPIVKVGPAVNRSRGDEVDGDGPPYTSTHKPSNV